MRLGIDLVLNPRARRLQNGQPLRRRLLEQAKHVGARVHETADLAALDRVAAEIAAAGTRAVVLAGGDGSMMRGLSALGRAFGADLPPVALAPAGTVGTVALGLGLRGRACAVRVLAAVGSGTARTVSSPTLRVRDASGEHIGFIFGAGLVARFFDAYQRAPQPGRWAAARIAARIFAGSLVGSPFARHVLERAPCTLTVDGERQVAGGFSLIVASVLRDVGLHFRVTYRAGESPGRFHVVASGLPPRALGSQVFRALAGKALRGEPRVDALARAMRVEFDGGGDSGAYVIDGDVLRSPWVEVDAGPEIHLLMG